VNSAAGLPLFNEDLARAFFKEAVRYLEDAKTLHVAGSYAGSIANDLKAVEFGLKALLLLDGTAAFLTNLFQTHDVFTRIMQSKDIVFGIHIQNIDTIYQGLSGDIKTLEKLNPSSLNLEKISNDEPVNPEYPFYLKPPNSSVTLYLPSRYFNQTDSETHFHTAFACFRGYRVCILTLTHGASRYVVPSRQVAYKTYTLLTTFPSNKRPPCHVYLTS